jgi:hypothetical protein
MVKIGHPLRRISKSPLLSNQGPRAPPGLPLLPQSDPINQNQKGELPMSLKTMDLDQSTIDTLEKTLQGRLYLQRFNRRAEENDLAEAVKQLVELIEAQMIDAAFGVDSEDFLDSQEMTELENLLNPTIAFDTKILEEAFDKIPDNEVSAAAHDALSSLTRALCHTYFNAGVLMGARLKGASLSELQSIAQRWK